MIILHFDLQPQFKYMNYFIYTSHQNLLKLSIGTDADDTVSTFLTPAQKSSSRFYKKDLNNVEKQLAKNRLVLDPE